MNNINNKINVAVVGLGKSGVAAANLACDKGYNVFASDSGKAKTHSEIKLNKKVSVEFGSNSEKILERDIIIKSPGISSDLPVFKEAIKRNIPIISECDFALNFIKPKKLIAVTGTNGKTTTTTLIYEIIKKAYKNTVVAGNIGYPLSSLVKKINNKTIVVAELSSYQLEDSSCFRPDVSVILNITPDHLKHHKTMNNYVKAKSNIFINQKMKDFIIYNYNDKILRKITSNIKPTVFPFNTNLKKTNAVYYENGNICIKYQNKEIKISPDIKIPGMHNIDNILSSAAAAFLVGVKPKIIEKVISSFKGVEHRIEFVRTVAGVSYYNDSKATNVDSTKVALESFDKNIQLILGGQDKGSPYKPIYNLIKKRVKNIFLIGEAAPIIKEELKGSAQMYECGTLLNAVKKIQTLSQNGDIALFSPACASFDQFENFEHRGSEFKKIVLSLN